MVDNLKQSNILLCGSSRVGKSTLINAICQRKLAKCSASLNSRTKNVDRYLCECTDGATTHETIIWDTPGIESWNENDVRTYMAELIEQTNPLCMIYCASPGSFAVLDHVAWLVSECYRKNIFCALVCTNMWAGRNRQEVVNEFCKVVSRVHPKIQAKKEDNIIYYGNIALVTMVNSQEYIDNDFGVSKPSSGVEELIFGIAKSLNRDLMFAWFRTVSQNTSFWSKMSSKLSDLFHIPTDTFSTLYEHAACFLDFLVNLNDFPSDFSTPIAHDNSSLPTKNTDESLFQDAEMIDMPEQTQHKKLIFTFTSENVETMAEVNRSLSNLGAKSCKNEEVKGEDGQLFILTAEFENAERIKTIYSLWQLASNTKTTVQLLED